MAHDHEHHHSLSYADTVRAYRADKDDFFRSSPGSPVPAAERASFEGLPYFEADERWVVDDLALEPYEGDEPVQFQIPTTDGRLRPAERAGRFRFRIAGQDAALTAYRLARSDGTGTLDFNMAYHPSCVYDPRFSCPLTPAENRLPLRVEAGERLAEGAH